jgi:small-conductance mechanosensitive channel
MNFNLYCSTCQCVACPACFPISHLTHTIREIPDVDGEAKSELTEAATALQSLMGNAREQCQQVKQTQETWHNNTSSAIATTHSVVQQMNQMVDKKIQEIDDEMNNVSQEEGAKGDIQTKNLTLNLQQLDSMHTFIESLLKRGSAFNRLASLPEVRSRLQQFQCSSPDPAGGAPSSDVPSSADLVIAHLNRLSLKEEVKLSDTGPTLEIVVKCGIEQERVCEHFFL